MDQGFLDALETKFHRFTSIELPQEQHLQEFRLLFSLFFERLTQGESINFVTLFSRIAYTGVKFRLPGKLTFECQRWRRTINKSLYTQKDVARLIREGAYLLSAVVQAIPDFKNMTGFPRPASLDKVTEASIEFKRSIRACLLEVHETEIVVVDEDQPHIKIKVRFEDPSLLKQAQDAAKYFDLPIDVTLVDVNYQEKGKATALSLVIQPDFLLGVTSVSECYSAQGSTALSYLARKLIPSDFSTHMLVGNIVNNFLDELIHDPELDFKDMYESIFRLAPVAFSRMDDDELRKVLSKIEVHFHNLKSVVKAELAEVGITKEASYLEPSFYSNIYGLQGRLDLFHHEVKASKADIKCYPSSKCKS